MIVGELDPDVVEHHPTSPTKQQRHNQGSVRDDADEIVNGTTHSTYDDVFIHPHIPARSTISYPSAIGEESRLFERSCANGISWES